MRAEDKDYIIDDSCQKDRIPRKAGIIQGLIY